MNVIVIMKLCGISYRDKYISELKIALQQQGLQLIYSNSSNNLLKLIEHHPQVCGVIFNWNNFSIILLQNLKQFNEYLPLYVFTNNNKSIKNLKINNLDMSLYFLSMLRMQLMILHYILNSALISTLTTLHLH